MFGRKAPRPKQPSVSREQAMACVPVRNPAVEAHPLDDGLVRLTYPLALKPWFARLASRFGAWDDKPLTKTVELDELGTFTWESINGNRTVGEIAEQFTARWGLHPREAELSVAAFIKDLGARGIVALRIPDAQHANDRGNP